jgi:hypothetical protein
MNNEIKHKRHGRFPKTMTEEEKLNAILESYERQKQYSKNKYYNQEKDKQEMCECGKMIRTDYMPMHMVTNLHKNRMERKEKGVTTKNENYNII